MPIMRQRFLSEVAALTPSTAIMTKNGSALPAKANKLTDRKLLQRSKSLSFPITTIYSSQETIGTSMES